MKKTRPKNTIPRTVIALILILEVVYVAVEIGFNAALLNGASGAVDIGNLDTIETFGRSLAGIGLGLLITSALLFRANRRTPTLAGLALTILVVMPPSIYHRENC